MRPQQQKPCKEHFAFLNSGLAELNGCLLPATHQYSMLLEITWNAIATTPHTIYRSAISKVKALLQQLTPRGHPADVDSSVGGVSVCLRHAAPVVL
jgi:hypothetical protein